LAALRFIPKISAISLAVYPSIFIISEYNISELKIIALKLQFTKQTISKKSEKNKKMKFIGYFFIDIMKYKGYIIYS
jgi:hypothetical protein